ncbi:MAG: hypothetical protein DRQ13_05135 [Ignavibacteriae bacterium]|nr:MAG: hypothetical protein DRQ13_05135 [Ignavibacteriota bacterium]
MLRQIVIISTSLLISPSLDKRRVGMSSNVTKKIKEFYYSNEIFNFQFILDSSNWSPVVMKKKGG